MLIGRFQSSYETILHGPIGRKAGCLTCNSWYTSAITTKRLPVPQLRSRSIHGPLGRLSSKILNAPSSVVLGEGGPFSVRPPSPIPSSCRKVCTLPAMDLELLPLRVDWTIRAMCGVNRPPSLSRQSCTLWCWAACFAWLQHYVQGPYLTEELVVGRRNSYCTPTILLDHPCTRPCNKALAFADVRDLADQRLHLQCSAKLDSVDEDLLLRELCGNRPVLLGLERSDGSGHLILAHGLMRRDTRELIVYDPYSSATIVHYFLADLLSPPRHGPHPDNLRLRHMWWGFQQRDPLK